MTVAGVASFLGYTISPVLLTLLGYAPARRAWAIAGALLTLAFVAAISADVFGEDSYVGDGSSNWSNRGAGPHTIYVLVAVAAVAFAGVLALTARRKTRRGIMRRALRIGGIAELVLGYVVLFAFDNN